KPLGDFGKRDPLALALLLFLKASDALLIPLRRLAPAHNSLSASRSFICHARSLRRPHHDERRGSQRCEQRLRSSSRYPYCIRSRVMLPECFILKTPLQQRDLQCLNLLKRLACDSLQVAVHSHSRFDHTEDLCLTLCPKTPFPVRQFFASCRWARTITQEPVERPVRARLAISR